MSELPLLDLAPAHLELVREILGRHVPQREVWAFGSRVQGRAKRHSDLDLAILGDEPLSLATLADMREAFSVSDLPIKVDVVEWATTTEAFRRIIAAGHVVVQAEPC